MAIPLILLEIKKHLVSSGLDLLREHDDGRLNSAVNEGQILALIREKFHIEEPNIREWYDFIAIENGIKYPVNIKVSTLETNDNVQCKLGIYYAVTGIWPSFSNGTSWENFFSKVGEGLNQNENGDYYFLVVGKSDPKDIILTSLKQIGTLVPNGNNLPFQCHWGRNRNLTERSHADAVKFILGALKKSCELRANIKSEFEKYLSGAF